MATDVSRENEKDGMIMKNYSEDVNRQYHIQCDPSGRSEKMCKDCTVF